MCHIYFLVVNLLHRFKFSITFHLSLSPSRKYLKWSKSISISIIFYFHPLGRNCWVDVCLINPTLWKVTPLSLSLFLCHFLSLSVFHPLTLSHMSLIPQLFHSNTLTHTHTPIHTHAHKSGFSFSLTRADWHTHSRTLSLAFSAYLWLSLSLSRSVARSHRCLVPGFGVAWKDGADASPAKKARESSVSWN